MRNRRAVPASPAFSRSDCAPGADTVMALCGAVVSCAQAPTTATTDRPNVRATHRAKKTLWLVDEKIGNLDIVASCDGRIVHLTDGDTGSDSHDMSDSWR